MLGRRAVILGHHYQRESVIEFADFRGDSFKLSQLAAAQPEAEFIVFCGVHFMAESADILRQPHQTVVLPDLKAGCSMADMAAIEDVEEAWDRLTARHGDTIVPVTYMNSTRRAQGVLRRARRRGVHVVQRRRGAATGRGSGSRACSSSPTSTWAATPRSRWACRSSTWPSGTTAPEDLDAINARCYRPETRVILWRGFCSVHTKFTLRADSTRCGRPILPSRVLVHPECPFDVVQAADLVGSTEFIIDQVKQARPGSSWAIGTEINLVAPARRSSTRSRASARSRRTCARAPP